ncbi:MAG: aldehyde dehydrogenase family protein, partial [Pseudomonadota bacterium]
MTILKIKNPRTGAEDYEIMAPSEKELSAIAGRLRRAQPAWHALGAEGRAAVLLKFAEALAAHREDLIACLAQDTGRHFISAIEVDGSIGSIKRWAGSGGALIEDFKDSGRSQTMPNLAYKTNLRPYPLVGCISPWNFPLTLSLIDAIPALMAGCAVLLKPSEITSRFAAPLQAALAEVSELEQVFE